MRDSEKQKQWDHRHKRFSGQTKRVEVQGVIRIPGDTQDMRMQCKKACHCMKGTPIRQGQFSGFPVPALAPASAPMGHPSSSMGLLSGLLAVSSQRGDLWALDSVIFPHVESELTTLTRKLSSRSYPPEDKPGPFSPQSLQVPGSQRTGKKQRVDTCYSVCQLCLLFFHCQVRRMLS